MVAVGDCLLLLETVSSSQDPVLVNEGSAADMDKVFASSGTNLQQRARDSERLLETFTGLQQATTGRVGYDAYFFLEALGNWLSSCHYHSKIL